MKLKVAVHMLCRYPFFSGKLTRILKFLLSPVLDRPLRYRADAQALHFRFRHNLHQHQLTGRSLPSSRIAYAAAASSNKRRDSGELPEKLRLRHRFRPALQRLIKH